MWLFSHRDKELPQTWRRVSNNSISNSSNKKLVIKHNSREISKMIIPCSNVSIVDFEHVIAAGAVAISV